MSGCPSSEELSTQQDQAAVETNRDVDVGRTRGPQRVQGCARSPGQLSKGTVLCPGAQVAREPTTQPCLTQVVRVTSTGGPRNGEPARSPHGALPCTACRPCVFTGSPCLLPSRCGALSGPAGSSAPGHPHDVGENGDFSCPQVGFELIVPFLFGILKCINKRNRCTHCTLGHITRGSRPM